MVVGSAVPPAVVVDVLEVGAELAMESGSVVVLAESPVHADRSSARARTRRTGVLG
jgi:hypothetical protein